MIDPDHSDVPRVRRAVRERAAERAERQAWHAAARKLILRTIFDGEQLVVALLHGVWSTTPGAEDWLREHRREAKKAREKGRKGKRGR